MSPLTSTEGVLLFVMHTYCTFDRTTSLTFAVHASSRQRLHEITPLAQCIKEALLYALQKESSAKLANSIISVYRNAAAMLASRQRLCGRHGEGAPRASARVLEQWSRCGTGGLGCF